jgi:hypothetical protein
MDAADVKEKAAAVARGARKLREHLRRSPALEVMAAVAVGFIAGLAMRAFRKSGG